ncbi:MAG: chitobiase/beta-hexosaminidase C-terminal domain-containing protein [Bacteroidaceae bacterium]
MRKTTLTSTLKVTLLFLMTFLLGTGNVLAEDGLIVFGTAEGSVKINAENVTADDNLGNTWTINTVIETASFNQQPTYSQVGSAKKPATSITFTMSFPEKKVITAFSAKFGGFSGTAGNISMKLDDTEVATGALNTTSDVMVESNPNIEGSTFTITITDIAKGVKVYNISYSYSENGEIKETALAPTLTPSCEFEQESMDVVITNNEEGGTVYYTLDGENPTTDSQSITGESKTLTISQTTTVKAMAVQTDKNNSKIVSATYTKVAPAPVYESIAAFIEAKPDTKAKLQLTDALVYGNKNNKNVYLHDGTGMIQLYNSSGNLPATLTYGKKVSATFTGTYTLYSGQDEMQNATLTGEAVITDAATPYESQVVNVADITEEMVGKQVTVQGVMFQAAQLTSGSVIVKQGEDALTIYNAVNALTNTTFRTDVKADVSGFVLLYANKSGDKTLQLIPESEDCITYIQDVTVAEAPTLTEACEFTGSMDVTITNPEADGVVYYTLDGTDPTISDSESFSGESKTIKLTATTTVKAMTVVDGKTTSAIVSATYTMVAEKPEFAFAEAALELPMGSTSVPANVLTNNSNGNITYESSNTDVATVAQDGTVTLVAPGITTITATVSETESYQSATASYTILLLSGDGSWEHPYSPVDIIWSTQIDASQEVAVAGYYVGFPGNGADKAVADKLETTAMALSTVTEGVSVANTIPAQLQAVLREGTAVEANLGQWVVITGKKATYFSKPGIKNNSVSQRLALGNITIPADGYTTRYSAIPTIVPQGMKAGLVTVIEEEKLLINYCYAEGDVIPAMTGVVLMAQEGTYPQVFVAANTTTPENNCLRGSLADEETQAPEEDKEYCFYKLTRQNETLGFFWAAENGAAFTNKAGEAYLAIPKSENIQSGFSVNDLETGIIQTEAPAVKNGATYDLQGRRVARPTRGIYIQDGVLRLIK